MGLEKRVTGGLEVSESIFKLSEVLTDQIKLKLDRQRPHSLDHTYHLPCLIDTNNNVMMKLLIYDYEIKWMGKKYLEYQRPQGLHINHPNFPPGADYAGKICQ